MKEEVDLRKKEYVRVGRLDYLEMLLAAIEHAIDGGKQELKWPWSKKQDTAHIVNATVCGSWKKIGAGGEMFRICNECGHTERWELGGMPSSYWEEVPFSDVEKALRLAKQAHVKEKIELRIRQHEIARGKARALEYLAKVNNTPSVGEKHD